MPQSNVIFGFLFAAFLIFITSRGELPDYANIFFGSAKSGGSGGAGEGATNAPKTDAAPALSGLDRAFKNANDIAAGVQKMNDFGKWLSGK